MALSKKVEDTIHDLMQHGPGTLQPQDIAEFENLTIKELKSMASSPGSRVDPARAKQSIVSVVIWIILA